jgi:hypothetical protein
VGPDGVEHVGHQQAIDDESPVVARRHRRLAELLSQLESEVDGLV